jgi:predicted HAD superfamily hydrolase
MLARSIGSILFGVFVRLNLILKRIGKRPVRTIVGITRGTDKIQELTQPMRDSVPKEMHLDSFPAGASG